MRIVFFGDSLTAGTYGVSFVDKIAAALPGHTIINAGVSGDTSLNLYRRVDTDVIAQKPDGVFIMVGINDATAYIEPGSRPYYRLAKHIPGGVLNPIAFRENLRAVLGKLTAAGIRHLWVALPPVEYRPALVAGMRAVNDQAVEVCREMRVPALDVLAALTPADVPERPPMGIEHFRQIAQTRLVGSSYDRLRDQGGYTYSFDGMHLTEDGAGRIAALIVSFLREHGVL
ncbi:MAG: hypothetical protein K8I60_18205 [Anaerolineae bacterium]|nr:hypothetical protein [Anaerolineae bacterium]